MPDTDADRIYGLSTTDHNGTPTFRTFHTPRLPAYMAESARARGAVARLWVRVEGVDWRENVERPGWREVSYFLSSNGHRIAVTA